MNQLNKKYSIPYFVLTMVFCAMFSGCNADQKSRQDLPHYSLKQYIPLNIGEIGEVSIGISKDQLLSIRNNLVPSDSLSSNMFENVYLEGVSKKAEVDLAAYYIHNNILEGASLNIPWRDGYSEQVAQMVKKFVISFGEPTKVEFRTLKMREHLIFTGVIWEEKGALISLWFLNPSVWGGYADKIDKDEMNHLVYLSASYDSQNAMLFGVSLANIPQNIIDESNSIIGQKE